MQYFRGTKPIGTIIQRRTGVNYVKTDRGWVSEARLIAELKIVNRGLAKNEKVYHRDCTTIGKRGHNEPGNLVVLKFNLTKYRLLPAPEIIYLPIARHAERKSHV